MAKEELKNLTSEDREPVKVVVEYDKLCPTNETTPSTPTYNPLKSSPTPKEPNSLPTLPTRTTRRCAQGLTRSDPGQSCRDIYQCNPHLSSGYYWITTKHRKRYYEILHFVYCQMEDKNCGLRGMMRVGFLNMTDSAVSCPPSLIMTNQSGKRLCISSVGRDQFFSVEYQTYNKRYEYVCTPHAFYFSNPGRRMFTSIDQPYVAGLSITYRANGKRKHIWSFAGGAYGKPPSGNNCPCGYGGDRPPPYVANNNYYCEASRLIASKERIWYMNNTLWDGKDCYPTSRCCDNRCQPWFLTALPDRVNTNIEVRWMDPQYRSNGMVGIELLELYVY